VSGDEKKRTRIDFNFDQCGTEKRCRRGKTKEREKNISIKRTSNVNRNARETNDRVQRGEFPWMVRNH
jgi:hypothetical protein